MLARALSSTLLPVFLLHAAVLASSADAGDAQKSEAKVTLTVNDAKGLMSEIKRHRGKVVLVDFWATWCIPCLKNFSHTVEWSQKYADDGLVVMSVSMDDPDDESKQRALNFLKKQNATFTNFLSKLGGEDEAMKAFDVDDGAIPHYRIYDRRGNVFKKFGAAQDTPWGPKDVETAIQKALRK